MSESLNDKLKALGMDLGMGHLSQFKPAFKNDHPIHKVIDGDEINTIYGPAFFVSQDATDQLRQKVDINQPLNLSTVLVNPEIKNPRIIFLDTETSGLSGGTGTFIFIIGLGIYDGSSFKLHQLFMRDPGEEQAFLIALNQLIGDTNLLVTFNGKCFDMPLLTTRHRIQGFTPVLSPETHFHLDMLPVARRIWKTRLPSRSLGDLEREILGVSRTEDEVPGWLIPEMYFDYLSSGDARPMKRVIYHNAMDIISLAQLFFITNKMLISPLDQYINSIDLASIARIFERQNRLDEAIDLYEVSLAKGLPVDIYTQTIERYANIYKQKKDWKKAVGLWLKASEVNSFDSILELAKYYEHVSKDLDNAEIATQKAIFLVKKQPSPSWNQTVKINELTHRLFRIQGKKRG